MNPVIFFRPELAFSDELEAATRYFEVIGRRTSVPPNSLIIPRYSALPYNRELCEDIVAMGGEPINTYQQHCYVADMRNWYQHLSDVTPRTWFSIDQLPDKGPFVLKGATNSKKHEWNTHMFAADKRTAIEVCGRLNADGHIGHQHIYARQYVPLMRLEEGLNGLPISEEYRFFILDGQIVDSGFYWSSHSQDLGREYDPRIEVPKAFIEEIVARISKHIRFFVVDVARTEDGRWIVVELNDGQQSGLCDIAPSRFYKSLLKILLKE